MISSKFVCIRKAFEPGIGASVCSFNFRDGNKQNDPEILDHRINSFDNFLSPEKRKRINIQPSQKLSSSIIHNVTFQGYIIYSYILQLNQI